MGFWLFDYFQRKSEERRGKLKEEILAELGLQVKPFLDEQGKSVKEESKKLVKEFSKEVKDERKGLEAQVKELLEEFRDVKNQSEKVSGESSAVKKDSERIKAYAEEAKKEADGAVDSVKKMEALYKRTEELLNTIDAKLKEYKDNTIAAAVEKCTATVKSEMDIAVKAAREEYKTNLEDSIGLLEEKNIKRMNEFSAKLNEMSKEEIEVFKKKCLAEIAAFKKEYAAVQADHQRSMPRIDAAAQKFRELEARIIALSNFAQKSTCDLWFASSLSQMQRRQLKELYSDQYKGDALCYKKYLENRKDQLKGKKNLTPQELEIDFAPDVFKEMNDRLRIYRKEGLPKLLEAIDWLDGIKRNYAAASTPQPRDRKHNRY